ncbi:MAG: PTS glucose transporter subunit IIA [Actinomycetales bacterium]|nr:MAG: PTS glucose transporter subunit IIA [Actinomycetales bacterium]
MEAELNSITLTAPLTGMAIPIEMVPDPIFANKIVGEGIAIDPLSNELLAPCDGEVVLVHTFGHALTLLHHSGIEVLLHVGLDTADLKGEGFEVLVKAGDQVKTGDLLMKFELSVMTEKSKNTLTQIVITNTDKLRSFTTNTGFMEAGKNQLAVFTPKAK